VIFIEINVDKIINVFTKIFFVNVVNVYHIYGPRYPIQLNDVVCRILSNLVR